MKKILRVFPGRTSFTPIDSMAMVGYPRLQNPQADEVHISCTFTWDIRKAFDLKYAWSQYYKIVRLGGPAIDDNIDGFTPGVYVKNGVTFTSRGCNNQCPWCLVWKREGKLKQLPVYAGYIIQDNNFLQCDGRHRSEVYQMLRTQRNIQFSGGLDPGLLRYEDAEEMRVLKISQLFFASDTKGSIYQLRNAGELLKDLPRDKKRCYVLLAFANQTLDQAQEHLENVWHAGFMPFAQLYQPPDKLIEYSQEWKKLVRQWSRPAIMKTIMKGK